MHTVARVSCQLTIHTPGLVQQYHPQDLTGYQSSGLVVIIQTRHDLQGQHEERSVLI